MAATTTPTIPLADLHKQAPIEDADAGPDDLRCWSVTTLIGIVSGYGLEQYKIRQPIRLACEEFDEHGQRAPWVSRLKNEGLDSAVEYLTAFRWDAEALASTELGTAVHSACEAYALEGHRPTPDEIGTFIDRSQEKRSPKDKLVPDVVAAEAQTVGTMLDRFEAFLDRFQPTYLASEVTVYSPTYGYAGTCDGFLVIDGVPLIIDYKTSRDDLNNYGKPKLPYADAALQLAAYRYAEMAAIWRPRIGSYYRRRYYLISQAEREMAAPVPEVQGGAVIYITPERCEAYAARCDEAVFDAFLARLDDARWEFQASKDAIAKQPMVAGGGS